MTSINDTKDENACCFCGKPCPSSLNVCTSCLDERHKCPQCGGKMETRGSKGFDRHGREMEAEWDECTKCGLTI